MAPEPPPSAEDPRTASPLTTVQPDLLSERSNLSFSPLAITHFLDGNSAAATARRRRLESWISRDPTGVFSNDENNYLHRTDRHTRSLAKFVRLVELCRSAGIGADNETKPSSSALPRYEGELIFAPEFQTLVSALSDDPLPTSLHWVMFVPNILTLGDDEQRARWLPLCRDWKMIGCYAQTELGHGSNIRALETTATFLPHERGGEEGGSWVVNSPTLTSAKFWPGTLGRTANHAMVIARLIDGQGVDRGIHNFLVPLRSMDDHSLLEGVETGDVGPKVGYNNMDNGFARFDNVKIPRRNMLMRFATVDEKGNYKKTDQSDAANKVAYITMMQVRAYIISSSNEALAMACTIAIRYSAIRRQGYNTDRPTEGPAELQVLDYRQQQQRLLPLLAASYAIYFTGRHVLARLSDIEHQLVSGTGTVTKAVVSDIHATTSALKSFCTTLTADGIEDCRKACGGQGYLVCSGLVELSNTYLQSCTVEGDNQMLPQQVIKVLLKLVSAVQTSLADEDDKSTLADYEITDMSYLIAPLKAILRNNSSSNSTPIQSTFSFPATSKEQFFNFPHLLTAFQYRSACLLLDVAAQLQSSMETLSPQQAWNDCLLAMARASRAHAWYLLLRDFSQGLNDEQNNPSSCLGPNELNVLSQCLHLLALYWLDQDLSDFLQIQCLSLSQIPLVRSALLDALAQLRPHAVGLCDARDFSDFRLKSALGRYDGDVYPAIMEAARKDPLNEKTIGPGYEQSLKKLIVDGVGEYHGKRGVSGTMSRL